MTEKEMNKLADFLIERIKKMQRELDIEYFEKVQDMNQGYQITNTEPVTQELLDRETLLLVLELEKMLGTAVADDEFELASQLQKKIKDLKAKD